MVSNFSQFDYNRPIEESSLIQTPFPGVREAIRERLRQKSIPEETIPIILASLSDVILIAIRNGGISVPFGIITRLVFNFDALLRFFKDSFKSGLFYSSIIATGQPLDDTLTLKDLTLKLVTLLLLTSGHRVQTLSKISLCVASTLEYYLTKTSSYRSSTHRLLLTHQRPFHVATTQSISRWVKEILQRSGIDLVRKTAGGAINQQHSTIL
nr:unnamed protein product [Callosobruchus chinensis]